MTQLQITNGPSRELLFDALKYGWKVSFSVDFSRTMDMTLEVFVQGVEREDGSGEKWMLKLFDPQKSLGANLLQAYFNTKERIGVVEPIKN